MAGNRRVLHVFAHDNPASRGYEAAFDRHGWDCVATADCYQGLAELVRAPDAGFDCILVWLDGVAFDEREFFDIVSRRFREVPSLVYGSGGPAADPAWARVRGARPAGSAEELIALLGDADTPSVPRSVAVSPPSPPPSPAAPPSPLLSAEELQALLGDDEDD